MIKKHISFSFLFFLLCTNVNAEDKIGSFDPEKDLYLAHFDSKTDVDDLHSVAAIATLLAHPDLSEVNYHAVAGAYGIQGGLYVPANELFQLSFGDQWSDAHNDDEMALKEVSSLVEKTLKAGGNVWISEAGQSDFSADVVRWVAKNLPDVQTQERISIVQHSDWNEEVTDPEDLAYVKHHADYHKIPDGNAEGNGTPGFRSPEPVHSLELLKDERLKKIWEMAISIGNRYNGADNRYLNEAIKAGGFDFSDVAETCWIFGYADLKDSEAFFQTFAQ